MYLFADDTTEFLAFIWGAMPPLLAQHLTWNKCVKPTFHFLTELQRVVCANKAVKTSSAASVVGFINPLSNCLITSCRQMPDRYFHVTIYFLYLLGLGNDSTPPPRSWWWFTHENLLSLVWLVACDMGCSTMVKLIKWFWWSGTSTKRLVWLQMSPNVQQIAKAVVEGKWSQRMESEVSGNTLAKCWDWSPLKSV